MVVLASCKSQKTIATNNKPTTSPKNENTVAANSFEKELSAETKNISNKSLVRFVYDWYGTTYKYGGADKHGIDCSHFTSKLYADVYKKNITGTASSMEQETIAVKYPEMQEGDLVFFKINSDKVSHVGVYVGNNKFIHASTKKGVIISDLNEAYYKKYFYKAGKLK